MPYLIRPKRVEQKSTREKDDNKRLSNRIKHEKKPHARSHERTKRKIIHTKRAKPTKMESNQFKSH